MASLQARARVFPRSVCNSVFRQLHDELRHFLNFHSIYPLLNSKGLLGNSLDQSILTSPTITTEHQIDILISWLPKCDQPDYLTPFMLCLLETAGSAGDAHKELAEKLRLLGEREMMNLATHNDRSSDDDDLETDAATRTSRDQSERHYLLSDSHAGYSARLFHAKKKSLAPLKKCFICSISVFLATSVLCITSVVLFVKFAPHVLSEMPLDVIGSEILPLANMEWLESITVEFSSGSWGILLVETSSCSALPVNYSTILKSDPRTRFFGLKGSTIDALIPSANITPVNNPHIWITRTIGAYHSLNTQLYKNDPIGFCPSYQTDDLPKKCHPVDKSDFGKLVSFDFKEAGYFTFTLTYPNDAMDIRHSNTSINWNYTLRKYDMDTINKDFKYKTIENDNQDSFTVDLSRSFHFNPVCVLFRYTVTSAPRGSSSSLKISHLKPRSDIIGLIFIVYSICTLVNILFVVLSVIGCLKLGKCIRSGSNISIM